MNDNVYSLMEAAKNRHPADEFSNMKLPVFREATESLLNLRMQYIAARRWPTKLVVMWVCFGILVVAAHVYQASNGEPAIGTDMIGAFMLVLGAPITSRMASASIERSRLSLRKAAVSRLDYCDDPFINRLAPLTSAVAKKRREDAQRLLMKEIEHSAETLGEPMSSLEASARQSRE